MRTGRAFWTVVVGLMISTLLPTGASALPITYEQLVTASGSLGASDFTNALVTLTAMADTTEVAQLAGGAFRVQSSSATVNVMGVGFGTFTIPTVMFVNQGGSTAGLYSGTLATPGPDILDIVVAAIATYDLKTAIGPVSGASIFNATAFATTAGNFNLTSAGTVTFTATLNQTAVPEEPSTLALFTLSCVTLALWLQSRQCRSRLG